MSKRHKMNRNSKAIAPSQTRKRIAPIAAGILFILAVLVCASLWWWKTNRAEAASSNQPVVTKQADFEKLKGKWLRRDGGYVLEIKQISTDGRIDAAYLNPRPINISKALASSENGQTKVFAELRDRLYPGSYYTLIYDSGKDQLAGVYHHLGINQQFDVIFMRIK